MADRDHALSPKQWEILSYIKKRIDEKGYPPSIREICKAVGLSSTSSVHAHLAAIEKKGYIKRDPEKTRAILVSRDMLDEGRADVRLIPVIKSPTAGDGLFSDDNIAGHFPLPAGIVPEGDAFAMGGIEGGLAGAGDGVRIFVGCTDKAKDGDMVVSVIGDSAAVGIYDGSGAPLDGGPVIVGRVFGIYRDLYGEHKW